MTDRTDAIQAAIDATKPDELQWLPNPGHEPEIPEGWEIAGARFSDGDEYTVPPNGRILSLADANVTEYAIRRKPTQPSQIDAIKAAIEAAELQWLPNPGHEPEIPEGWELAGVRLIKSGDEFDCGNPSNWEWSPSRVHEQITRYAIRRKPTQPSESQGVRAQPTLDQALEQLRIEAERIQQPNPQPTLERVTPVTEDAGELRKRIVLEFLRQAPGNWFDCSEIANETCSTINETGDALIALCKEGLAAYDVVHVRYCVPAPIRQQSGALVIAGRLTAVGETFATILTGTRTLADQLAGVSSQQVTLGINTDQARWLGRYVGGEVTLTVEVQL